MHFWSSNFLVKHSVQKLSQKIAENSKTFNVSGLILDNVLFDVFISLCLFSNQFWNNSIWKCHSLSKRLQPIYHILYKDKKMVKELRFLLDKPSGLQLQNGSTLWQFCTLGGVETKIDHLLFISSFDQWIDLQDAIIGFEKKMRIWLSEKMSKICIWAYSILPHHLRIILALAYVASGL